MAKEYFKVIPAVYLMLIKEGKILMLRRYNTGHKDGMYSLPAGHLNGKERLDAAMCREAKEEVGIILQPEHLKLVHVTSKECLGGERVDFFFQAEKWEGEPNNKEPHKCDDLQWFFLDALPENTIGYVRHALEHIGQGVVYSNYEIVE